MRTTHLPKQLLPAAIVLATWLAGVLLVALLLLRPNFALLLVLAAGAAGAVGVALRFGRVVYLLPAIALSGIMLPDGYRVGSTSVFIPTALVLSAALVGWSGVRLLLNYDRFRPRLPLVWPLIAFVIVNILAYIWGVLLRDPLLGTWQAFNFIQPLALLVNILLPLTAVAAAHTLTEAHWLHLTLWCAVAAGLLIYAMRLLNLPFEVLLRSGTFGLAGMWVGTLALAHALFNRRLRPLLRAGLGAAALGILGRNLLLASGWLSGWIPLAAAVGVLIWLRSRRVALLLAGLALLVAALNAGWLYDQIVVANLNEGSGNRLALWQANWGFISAHPLFGMGPAGYTLYNQLYLAGDFAFTSTHNNYLDIIAQVGVIGTAVFVWLALAIARAAQRLWRRFGPAGDADSAFAAAAAAGLCGAALSMMFGDWVLPYAYNQTILGFTNAVYTWLVLGGLMFMLGEEPARNG